MNIWIWWEGSKGHQPKFKKTQNYTESKILLDTQRLRVSDGLHYVEAKLLIDTQHLRVPGGLNKMVYPKSAPH